MQAFSWLFFAAAGFSLFAGTDGAVRCPPGTVPFGFGEKKTATITCEAVADASREAMAFLRSNMPSFDAPNEASLFNGGIAVPTVNLSLSAKAAYPWAGDVSKDLFMDYVLPYAHVNEARTDWRAFLASKLAPLVHNSTFTASTKMEAALILNNRMWETLGGIVFKSEQTPLIYDPMSTIVFGYASCTGVSILFADALRAVGIPSRIVGTPAWNGNISNGNHNWVEVYLGPGAAGSQGDSGWYFIEARPAGGGETYANPCDKWFCNKAKFAAGKTSVFAPRFSKNSKTHYPMAWDLSNKEIPGTDRSSYYASVCSKC